MIVRSVPARRASATMRRLVDDVLAGDCGRAQGIAVVCAQIARYGNVDFPFRTEHPTLGAHRARQRIADAVVAGQIGHAARCAMRLQIRRRGAHSRPARRNSTRDQARIAQIADADREVPALLRKIDNPVIEAEIDAHLRMAARKLREQRSDLPGAERDRRIEAQHAARLEAVRSNGAVCGVEFGENARRRLEIVATRLGDREPARGAVKERNAQPGFERGDVLGDHGLRHAHRPARGGQAAHGGNLGKDLQPGEAIQHRRSHSTSMK